MINFIKKIVLILILTLINLYAYINNLTRNMLLEDKIYCDVSIYDEFADDRVMVVLSKNASYNRKSYSYDDFNKYECSSVTEFTQSSSCFKNKDSKEHNRVFCLELTTKSKQNVLDVMEDLMKREDVVYAGPDFKINVLSTTPGDSYWENQSESMDIGLPDAWNFSTGSKQVLVGVMDTGIDSLHPDLQDSINNELSRDFTNGFDEEVDYATDMNGHGTHVAGIIGAKGNNGIGISGVCWDVSLVSLRIFDENGIGYSSNAARAIEYATRNNIDILNISGGWLQSYNNYDVALNSVIEAYDGIVIAAAGNSGFDNDGPNATLPASINLDNIISVGSIGSNDERAVWENGYSSNYGINSVDIYAPGTNILSTYSQYSCDIHGENYPNSHYWYGYHLLSGTSMSAPFVTGLAALLVSINQDLTTSQLKSAIVNSGGTISISLPDETRQTVKKLNAFNAVKYVLTHYGISGNITYGEQTFSNNVISSSEYYNEKNFFLKINISYEYSYDFTISSSDFMIITLYDSNFEEIRTIYDDLNSDTPIEFSENLTNGTYYIKSNYVDNETIGTISVTVDGGVHTHDYSMTYYNYKWHILRCDCGSTLGSYEVHTVRQSQIINGRFAPCIGCGRILDLTKDNALPGINSILVSKITVNGSYILPSGIIVLVDEDYDDYINGELIFYDKEKEKE